jgi:hypothetical protein
LLVRGGLPWIGRTWALLSGGLGDAIRLPGALQHQGYGDPISTDTPWVAKLVDLKWYTKDKYARYTQPGNVLVPFFLQPDRHYVGPAWYQRDIRVPADWRAMRVVLTLERPHWQTQVWLDDRLAGTNASLGTPHVYDPGPVLRRAVTGSRSGSTTG